jgi:hypothetical protein
MRSEIREARISIGFSLNCDRRTAAVSMAIRSAVPAIPHGMIFVISFQAAFWATVKCLGAVPTLPVVAGEFLRDANRAGFTRAEPLRLASVYVSLFLGIGVFDQLQIRFFDQGLVCV